MARRLLKEEPAKETNMPSSHHFRTRWLALGLAAALLATSSSVRADDSVLFSTTAVAPNVLLLLDSSASMNNLIWHPAFNPAAAVSCNSATYGSFPAAAQGAFNPNATYWGENNKFYYKNAVGTLIQLGSLTRTHCGKTRTIPADNNASADPTILGGNKKYTWYSGAYLNWYFSTQADPYVADITSNSNGIPTSCVGGVAFAKYGRTRMNVTKQVLKDIVCQVNLVGEVRFGIAQYRNRANGTTDTNGAYVIEPVDVPSSNQQADLVSAINSVDADSDAPLGEGLFQLYTYFMSRASDVTMRPVGKDGVTHFPRYEYDVSSSGTGGNQTNSSNSWAVDPVQYSCQKHFIMIITDGDSTKDNFTVVNDTPEAAGFADFKDKLIGDYNPDGETEEQPNLVYTNSLSSLYLDDIAKFMTEKDFRPKDFDGEQTIDTYTIGFHASDSANTLLAKTAQVGNGLFFAVNDEAALAQAIIDQLQNIIEKAQSFTAATVPASRTQDGEQLYVSLFTPTSKSPYWDGHLRSYRLNGAGQILDANGSCAVDSVDCFSGAFKPVDVAPPYWDASTSMPAPGSRNLLASVLRGGSLDPAVVQFVHQSPVGGVPPANALDAADLGVTFPPASTPAGSIATDVEQYTDEIMASVRGCSFGTGANGIPCTEREGQLPDIFHSNPVVVGQPVMFESDPSYKVGFKGLVQNRDRVIYAGSNGGFLHGFHAGDWDTSATPPRYDAGTGVELFGFMPWTARQKIQYKPFDKGNRDYYYVDGSPTVADVWFYTNWQVGSKVAAGTEWRTVLVTGSRQGGETYLALDVSDPDAGSCNSPAQGSGYPCYLWEFPREDDTSPAQDYVAETWGDPIVTKVRVTDGSNVYERWVAIVTGGYSEKSDPNQHAAYDPDSLAGRGIAVIDMKTGSLLAARSFDPAGDCANPGSLVNNTPERKMCFAIPSTPAVYDADGDGFADVLYVGDLGGNLWKWVLKAPLELSGATTAVDADGDWPFRRVFAAPVYNDGTNNYYKSIYFPPAGTRKNGKIWLAFGTGERNDLLYMSDPATTEDNNRFYVIEETDLWEQAATPQAEITEANDLVDLDSTNTCGDLAGKRGYFIVGQEGEKWVTNVEIFVGYVIVNSYVPEPSTDPCEIGGKAYLWAFSVDCGEGLFTDAAGNKERTLDIGAGLPTDPRVTVGANGESSNRLIISKQGGDIINLEAPPGFPGSGMFYWRELID